MCNVLKGWQFLALTEKGLEIAKTGRSFSSTYFDEPERLSQLSRYCREFFGRDLQVKIMAATPASKKTKERPSKERSKTTRKELSPPVQDILHMFQGEIVESRPAKAEDSREEVKE